MRFTMIFTAAILLPSALAVPAAAQQDSAAAAADSALAPDSAAADTSSQAAVPHVVPSLEGFRKVAIMYRDMLPGTPGDETGVEIFRGPERAQVLRFVTGGVAWAFVVRPAGATDSYTLRDFDCSGGFTEDLEAGTPLAVPDCAVPPGPGAAPPSDD
ncbi:MAG TPA: hypothetical protein VEY33_00170 [Gemmatimonadota bacterium]|nr:hypothetical protein [Gemmatimonadota bacterium]